jgi:sortase (surface protein transpeptidase)
MNLSPWRAGVKHPVRTWGLIAGALVLIGSGCIVLGLQEHQHPLAGPAPSSRVPKPVQAKAAPVNTAELATARSSPVQLEIPAISLTVSLSTLGLNPDDTVQVPTDVQQPGWYGLGPSPGQIGSAVILGHVDSLAGPAVFFELRSLVPGDAVNVTLADGVTAEFKVTSAAMYPKTSFPDQLVYTSHGYSALQLVTCGGSFDEQTGHYLSNVVVYTSLVALVAPRVAQGVQAPSHPL